MSIRTSNLLILLLLGACARVEGLVDGRVAPLPATFPERPEGEAPASGSIYAAAHWGGRGHRMMLAEDRRARGVGDQLTILLVERLSAEKSTSADGSRSSQRALDLPDALPFSSIPEGLFSGGGSTDFSGSGSARQANRLSGELSVTVAAVLPNGAFLVSGERRLVLTRGEEQVQISGLVRPEDIGPDNRVPSTRVADARIRYSGTGEVAAQARQGWLSRFFDRLSPF